jgi:hypothetical protein
LRKKYDYGFKKSVSDILGCPWCSSIWISLFFIPLYVIFPKEIFIVSVIFAVSGISVFFYFLTHYVREIKYLSEIKSENEKQKLEK